MLTDSLRRMPRIAIIGAGPGGCTLARLLVQKSIPVTVFEWETAINARSQGGSLDLRKTTGLKAVREAGLYSEFLKHARLGGDGMKLCDQRMRPLLNIGSSSERVWMSRGAPEIDRSDLRTILLKSLPRDTIRWGCRLQRVDEDNGSLVFEHGVECDFDLVVGADGAFSRVRKLLSDVRPFYSGIGGYTASISDPAIRIPDVYQMVNGGSWLNHSQGHQIAAQQMGDGSLYVNIWQVRDENWERTADYDTLDGSAVKAVLNRIYQDWNPMIQKLLGAIDVKSLVPRNLYMLPVDFRWQHRPGFTLLGDAAHMMTLFAGEGVNTAMEDALELAEAIAGAASTSGPGREDFDNRVQKYEAALFTRANRVQRRTADMMHLMMFTPGAPNTSIERWLIRSFSDHVHGLFLPLVKALTYAIFYFRKRILI